MAVLCFTSVIKLRDCNPYILVTAAQAKSIKPGWRKPLSVVVRINGRPERALHALSGRKGRFMAPAGDGGA